MPRYYWYYNDSPIRFSKVKQGDSVAVAGLSLIIFIPKWKFTIKRLEVVRDIFVFCPFTGLAFVDVNHLRPEHLLKDSNDALWNRKPREKTRNMCNIPILSSAKIIIDRYKGHPLCLRSGVLLPVLTNQKMNSYLKDISDLCGITNRITTHTALHYVLKKAAYKKIYTDR